MNPTVAEKRIAEVRAIQFKCSVCGAKPGEGCVTRAGLKAGEKPTPALEPHKPRENAREDHIAELRKLLDHEKRVAKDSTPDPQVKIW